MTEVVDRSLPANKKVIFNVHALAPNHAYESVGERPAKKINVQNLQTLVLNADYLPLWTWPLSLVPVHEALTDIYKQTTHVVDTWKDAFGNDLVFRSPSTTVPAPKVMVLNQYVSVASVPKFSRRSILLRDRYCCQYCGERFPANELTFDHVIPRDKGGKTTWENIVMACSPCNSRKANKMPEFSGPKGPRGNGLRPLKMPMRPTNAELIRIGLEFLPASIKEDYGSWLYWTVELDP